ncbi:MAG: hypothetical protein KIH63_004200 [Candidatus Saccharibacteria bacterium]|nr:hypothetical protein [Candidatus Saccharibacteria bacterium]
MAHLVGFDFERLGGLSSIDRRDPAVTVDLPIQPAFDTKHAAELGAETLMAMFPEAVTDRIAVQDRLEEQLEQLLPVAIAGATPSVGVNISNIQGEGITWPDLRAGYERVADRSKGKTTYVWPDMYALRDANWHNQRTPRGVDSFMTDEPYFGSVVSGLMGMGRGWDRQQQMLFEHVDATYPAPTEGMTVADWLMHDAQAIVSSGEQPRPDVFPEHTRFVQHDRVVPDLGGVYGPTACVTRKGTVLRGTVGDADDGGIRLLMGPIGLSG